MKSQNVRSYQVLLSDGHYNVHQNVTVEIENGVLLIFKEGNLFQAYGVGAWKSCDLYEGP